ncbi:MAG TPA: ABC transporter ATP-binding protein [Rhodospirillaceae bacterium]|nr:ABC transporter ATP-binding protein [Rhodospirillaceae bacterium]
MVEIRDLVYEYPGFRALHSISAEIEPATITALVGPNGAGKTTLLRCLAALEPPYSGAITLDGLDIHGEPRKSHEMMGYLSDFFGLYDKLSVEQCLTYRADAQGLDEADRQAAIEWAAKAVKLSDRLDQKAGELSRGLRQRLAIGQAIIHRPKLLLLDEPASGLDPEAREDLANLLLELREGGMTIVVSSHILAELEAYSSHMLIIDDGRIVDHTAIRSTEASEKPVRLAIELSEAHPDFEKLLKNEGELIEISKTAARLDITGGPDSRQSLLKRLVDAGLPVASFGPERVNLQDAYIERVREGRQS